MMLKFLALSLMLAFFLPVSAEDALQPSPKLKEKYRPDFIALLQAAEKVETHRLKDIRGPSTRVAQGKSFGKERAREIAGFLLNDDNFRWSDPVKCEPIWGFLMVLWSGKDRVEISICFHCSQMSIKAFKGETEEKENRYFFDFHNGQTLAAWAKEALPDDPEIQKLSEKKKE